MDGWHLSWLYHQPMARGPMVGTHLIKWYPPSKLVWLAGKSLSLIGNTSSNVWVFSGVMLLFPGLPQKRFGHQDAKR